MKFQPPKNRASFGWVLIVSGGWLAAPHLHAQLARTPSNAPQHSAQTSAQPAKSRARKPKDSSKKAAQRVGKSLNLTGSGSLRAAPLNEEGQGGYSSGMDAPQPTPANPALEEQVMQDMLLNSDRWRVGPHGLIERLRGNNEWAAEPSGVKTDLHAIAFVSRRVGWVVGDHGTILRTQDGGRSWQRILFPSADDVVEVRASGAKSLQVVTQGGRIFSSSDGGKVWKAVPQQASSKGTGRP